MNESDKMVLFKFNYNSLHWVYNGFDIFFRIKNYKTALFKNTKSLITISTNRR